MDKTNKTVKEKNANKNSKQEYLKKITYSTSKNEKIDLLDVVEMYLCKACIKL
jgi:hypothetical protein fgonA2_07221